MLNYLFTETPLFFFVQSFWRDEGFTYLLAKKNIFQILISTAHDFSPPLYYLALHFWMRIFGNSEVSIRSLSLIFYWATLYVIFLFLNDIFGFSSKKSWLYLSIFILNPILVYYAFEGRMYSMFAFFATLSFYSLYKKDSRLYFLSSVFGLYTHYFMILVIAVQYFFSRFRQLNILLSYLPWMIFVLFLRGIGSQPFWIQNSSLSILIAFLGQVFTGYYYSLKFYNLQIMKLSLGILALLIFGYLKFRKEKRQSRKLFYYLLSWGVGIPFVVVLISFVKPMFLPRYLIFSAVGLILLIILILEKLPLLLRVFIIALLIAVSFNYQKLEIKYRQKTDIRKSLKEIKSLMNQGDLLYVTSELDYFIAAYYLDENKVFVYGKSYGEIPDYVGKILLPKEKVVSSLPLYPKKAFILDSWGNYNIQATY